MNTKKILLISLLSTLSTAAIAQNSGLYSSAGLSETRISDDFVSYKMLALESRFGYQVSPFFAIETQVAIGFDGYENFDYKNENDYSRDTVDLNHYVGIYLKPQLQINDNFSCYTLIGYAHAEIKSEGKSYDNGDRDRDSYKNSINDEDFS